MSGRRKKTNDWVYTLAPTVSTNLASRRNSIHALPFDVKRVSEWGCAVDTAGQGSAIVTMNLLTLMSGSEVVIADPIVYDLDADVNTGFISAGLDFGVFALTDYPRQNTIIKLDLSFDGGTALSESYFHLWIIYTT